MNICQNGELERDRVQATRGQIRSRERVRNLAEVYTNEREVDAMLDLVVDMLPTARDPGNIDRSFFEPACGDGNFLVEILRRKLEYVTLENYGTAEHFEHGVLRCLASIYGVDISEENVRESRRRMRSVVQTRCDEGADLGARTCGFRDAVEVILETNVIRADSLSDAAAIELIGYKPVGLGSFIREWFRPLDPTAGEPNLLSPPPLRDEMPVHYSELVRSNHWAMRNLADRNAA